MIYAILTATAYTGPIEGDAAPGPIPGAEVVTLADHCRRISRLTKGQPKSPEHRAKLRAILAEARARKAAKKEAGNA